MSERDRGMAIALLAEAFGVKPDNLTPARIRIYSKALEAVPVPVLDPMVQRAIATRKPRWGDLPPVSELLEDAEAARMEILRSLTYSPCAQCNETGWKTTLIDGISRVKRCICWEMHQQKVQQLGVGSSPLAIESGKDA